VHDRRDVVLDRARAQVQPARDLDVLVALDDEPQDVVLALGERHVRLGRRGVVVRAADAVDEQAAHARRDQRVPRERGAEAGDDLLGVGLLEQVAGGPGEQGVDDVALLERPGEHDHGQARAQGEHLARGLDPAHPRHREVHEDHVGPAGVDRDDRLVTRRRLAHDVDPVLAQQGRESRAEQGVVVDDESAHGPGPVTPAQRECTASRRGAQQAGAGATGGRSPTGILRRVQEMVIYGVSFDMVGKQPIVLLKTVDSNKFLPIWIGHPEAAAILMKLQGASTPRPMTHDLMCDMLGELDVKCTQVSVTELRENTFFATITLTIDGKELEIDSRPSDALALAVRSGRADLRGRGGHRRVGDRVRARGRRPGRGRRQVQGLPGPRHPRGLPRGEQG
jgi:bifunctional DNase/RNase